MRPGPGPRGRNLFGGSTSTSESLTAGGSLPAVWTRRWAEDTKRSVLTGVGVPGVTELTAGALEEASRLAAGRLHEAGVTPGDRVLVSAGSSLELAIVVVGALRAGYVVVPANTAYGPREIAHLVRDAQLAAAVVDDSERASWVAAAAGSGSNPVTVFDTSIASRTSSGLAPGLLLDQCAPADPALIAYTSGTTGTPKGAVLTHGNLLANATSISIAWRWSPDDRLVLCLPLFHGHGLCNGLFGTLHAGASAIVMPAFDVTTVCRAAGGHSATLFFGVPTMYHRLAASPYAASLRPLRLCVSGSAPLPASVFEAFAAVSGHRPLERYGATEVLMALSNPVEGERRPGSVGFPLPGVEIDLAPGPDPADPTGEILVRSPMVFAGYRNLPEATSASLEGGWFHTGDLAEIAPDGYVTIVGRSKELIITGGLNVYPREVEEALARHPSVTEVAVVGLPSDEWGEQVTAYVVTDGTAPEGPELARDVLASAGSDLAPYKRPKEIRFVEALPRNALGKVVKSRLVR